MIYAIGDIHGKANMLEAALNQIDATLEDADSVVFVGDYIDRGEDSKRVIDLAMQFHQKHDKTIFLRGNHEEMMLDAYYEADFDLWMQNGGLQTLVSYGVSWPEEETDWREFIPESHVSFLQETMLEWQSEQFYFVHAGLVPPSQRESWGQPRSAYLVPAEPRLWIRKEFIESEDDFGKVVVFGHTVQKSHLPLIMGNKVGLDTGAFFEGKLTVGIFDDTTAEVAFFQIDQDLAIDFLKVHAMGKGAA